MKVHRLIPLALGVLVLGASAAVSGLLVKSEQVWSVTGKPVWKCTYYVSGQNVTVILQEQCPSSMMFD
jgi:hypothetical protein